MNESKTMKKQAGNHVNRKLSESDGAPAEPTGAVSGEFVTETLEYDGGRRVTVDVPLNPPQGIYLLSSISILDLAQADIAT